jgi:hypothetical protein
LAVSIIPLTLDYQNYSQEVLNISCNISAWFVLLGIGIIFSAFYSKTRRIYKIIKSSKRFRRIQVRIQDSLIPMVVLLSCTCGINLYFSLGKNETYMGRTPLYVSTDQCDVRPASINNLELTILIPTVFVFFPADSKHPCPFNYGCTRSDSL